MHQGRCRRPVLHQQLGQALQHFMSLVSTGLVLIVLEMIHIEGQGRQGLPGSARLRVSLSAAHTLQQVDRLCEALHDIEARHG